MRLCLEKSNWFSTLLIHRAMLRDQWVDGMQEWGMDVGVRASGIKPTPTAPVQVSMWQTEAARQGKWMLHPAQLLLIDECHQQTGQEAESVVRAYQKRGAFVVGFTATPVGLKGWDRLIVAATYEELRECGAHLPMKCYGPTRPDCKSLRKMTGGDYSSKAVEKVMPVPVIFGDVYEHWRRLNPGGLPSILWAPSVESSKWMVHHFQQKGVPWAHVDGESVHLPRWNYQGGKRVLLIDEHDSNQSTRSDLMEMSRMGDALGVSNRFVLREAIDMPWLKHGILATKYGALSSYLQSVGRLQRYWPSYDHVTLQDHGGNIDSHLEPDIERQWHLGSSNQDLAKKIKAEVESKPGRDAEPLVCPKCSGYRRGGAECPHCGHRHKMAVRSVRQVDGNLVQVRGRVVKYRAPKGPDDYLRSALFSKFSTGGTVGQAVGLAIARMRADGVRGSFKNIDVPAKTDPAWNYSVRQVYPWACPRHMRR